MSLELVVVEYISRPTFFKSYSSIFFTFVNLRSSSTERRGVGVYILLGIGDVDNTT